MELENTPSIWTPERRAIAIREAEEWRATPHFDRLRIKRRGVDCINFVLAILEACEVIPSTKLPFYRPGWGYGRTFNVMENLAHKCMWCVEAPDNEPYQFGDVIFFRAGVQSNHTGIVLNDELWHCAAGRRVETLRIDEQFYTAVQGAVRITQTGYKHPLTDLTQNDFLSE